MADFGQLNDLSPEIKILIVKGQTLVDKTRTGMKEKSTSLDLTGKMQLKSDCMEVEKLIKKISKGKKKVTPKLQEALRLAILRLETTSDGLLNRTWMG